MPVSGMEPTTDLSTCSDAQLQELFEWYSAELLLAPDDYDTAWFHIEWSRILLERSRRAHEGYKPTRRRRSTRLPRGSQGK